MQTIPTVTGSLITGGIQTPLLTEDQLEPGMFIAGNTMQNVWRVEDVDRGASMATLVKQPETALPPGHTHAFTLHQNTTCSCGWRRQSIRGDQTGLLPLRANTPRVYLIRPREPMQQPDKFTVYLTAAGTIIKLTDAGVWSTQLPLIPALHAVWTLPEALRGRMR